MSRYFECVYAVLNDLPDPNSRYDPDKMKSSDMYNNLLLPKLEFLDSGVKEEAINKHDRKIWFLSTTFKLIILNQYHLFKTRSVETTWEYYKGVIEEMKNYYHQKQTGKIKPLGNDEFLNLDMLSKHTGWYEHFPPKPIPDISALNLKSVIGANAGSFDEIEIRGIEGDDSRAIRLSLFDEVFQLP